MMKTLMKLIAGLLNVPSWIEDKFIQDIRSSLSHFSFMYFYLSYVEKGFVEQFNKKNCDKIEKFKKLKTILMKSLKCNDVSTFTQRL